ncbi:trypsin-2 [Folsomia candida]|uniref:Cationic trypsin-3 n=1 Tax=Folsomia candida TaxID=158441 RepID=A0A226DHL1_FOLCA|nr:trypsin-2 [Folsomia candida]OXA44723.1 Cationic trypsin-3 [Folsomia candida]
MKFSIFIIVSCVAMASGMPKPSDLDVPRPRLIVGGVEADRSEFPFIVDMRYGRTNSMHWCGGSIVTPEWVVSAAHCMQQAGGAAVYSVVAGEHNLTFGEGSEQLRQVVAIIDHPGYGRPLRFSNDITLLKVDPPFVFNEFVQPVVIPQLNFVPTAVATVAGWGDLQSGGPAPDVLMKVDVPFVAEPSCQTSYPGSISDSMVCYGEEGKDSCQADSGGPLMCGADKALCGIVSWGRGCAQAGYPGVYTETSFFAEWIRSTIAQPLLQPRMA